MTKKIQFLLLITICLYGIVFSADPFYTDILNKGKQLFISGKYDEALENFKIAEFGLLDEKEILPELYFYYALTYYRKGALTESKLLLNKMKTAMAIKDIKSLPRPKEIEHDIHIMIRAQQASDRVGAKSFSIEFFDLFYKTWDLIGQNKFQPAKTNMKRMEKIASNDFKLKFLQGFMAFQQGDYKKCIKYLEKISESKDEELREDTAYYLAVSFLKRNDLVNGNKYAKEIKNPDYIHRLMLLMDELKAKQQHSTIKK